MELSSSCRIGIVKWVDGDGIVAAFCEELTRLGHHPVCFKFDGAIPTDIDVALTFAPYNRWLHIPRQLAGRPAQSRPLFVHWNLENPPDLRIPWPVVSTLGACRSWVDRLNDSRLRAWVHRPPLSWINQRMHKYRYLGDYHYAYHKGWLNVYIESSQVYARLHSLHGLPALFVPWGTVHGWYAQLDLERDIDVLWMGKRRTKRRSQWLDWLRQQLSAHGVHMYVADDVEKPFLYGDLRTQFLNRAKITLNLLPTWYDNAFPYRFHVAAGNRSLVVSEPILPHYPLVEAGRHYIAAPVAALAETILYYLAHEDERRHVAENAYQLVTTKLTWGNSVKTLMEVIEAARCCWIERLLPRSD